MISPLGKSLDFSAQSNQVLELQLTAMPAVYQVNAVKQVQSLEDQENKAQRKV